MRHALTASSLLPLVDYLIVSKETKSSAWVISDRYNLDERNVPVYESKQDGVLLSAKQEGFWQTGLCSSSDYRSLITFGVISSSIAHLL